ncbi:hypothetical protein DSBG_1538 [Desulfosporosinus sp. BG]|nr:hypothetical protein DSBG_1538 [Desulfosporosinus sp. BG]
MDAATPFLLETLGEDTTDFNPHFNHTIEFINPVSISS